MKRRAILLAVIFGLGLGPGCGTAGFDGPAAEAPPPNIVLLMADDLGWGDVGFHGSAVVQTPHLDAMAEAGLRLDRFYAAAPVCSPTRGSVLTGRHPSRYGIDNANSGHLERDEYTLAELLRESGYSTGFFGKWHLGTLTRTERDSNRGGPEHAEHYAPPQERGFDVCFATEAKTPTWDPMLRPVGGGARWWDAVADGEPVEPFGTAYWDERGRRVEDGLEGGDSRAIMNRVLPFITGAVAGRRPFFAVVWFHAPHLPVVCGPDQRERYADHSGYRRSYYGSVTELDEQVGRLRSELRRLGVRENTMIWFASDNGPEGTSTGAPGSAGPFRGRKRDVYEGGLRVPAIVEWPAVVEPGRVTEVPAVTSDYLPTVLEALGCSAPDQRPFDGVSLLPMLRGESWEREAGIAFDYRGRQAFVKGRYKVVRCSEGAREGNDPALPPGTGVWQLFDVVEDPAETRDLSSVHPLLVASRVLEFAEWRTDCQQSAARAGY